MENSMTLARAFVAAAAALLLTACLPVTTKVPVGTTVGFKPDPMLLGTWRARGTNEKEGASNLTFLANNDGTMTAVLVTPPHDHWGGEWGAYELHAATLGANHYLNAREIIANGKIDHESPLTKRNIVLLYRAAGRGRIEIYQMDDKAAAAAIKAHEIAGDIEPGQDGDVHITADEPALDAFMRSSRAAAMFTKPLITMTRVD
jgi:hypothetical protein